MLDESSVGSDEAEEFNVEVVGFTESLLFPSDLDCIDCRLARPRDDRSSPWV